MVGIEDMVAMGYMGMVAIGFMKHGEV